MGMLRLERIDRKDKKRGNKLQKWSKHRDEELDQRMPGEIGKVKDVNIVDLEKFSFRTEIGRMRIKRGC
jgi:hypothetical protein